MLSSDKVTASCRAVISSDNTFVGMNGLCVKDKSTRSFWLVIDQTLLQVAAAELCCVGQYASQ
jgi:hypothetical protein